MQPTLSDRDTVEGQPASERDELVLPLHAEDVAVTHRTIATSVVRVETVTRTRDQLVDESLTLERVEIEHVPIGRYVDAVPAVREEGDVTVMPVVEEVLVVERKLLLREEVRIRRVRTVEQHVETVKVREQDVVITRTPAMEQDVPAVSTTPMKETER